MKKITIAITGGIGSGKTTVLDILKEEGYTVFSCDEIYKSVSESPEYLEQLKIIFPTAVVEGELNRQILSELVFKDKYKKMQLDTLAHPIIIRRLFEKINECTQNIVFAEVPLLFEGNFENLFDYVCYIYRDKEKRIESVLKRDALSRPQIENRIASQFDPDTSSGREKLQKCNVHILYNNQGKEALKSAVKILLSSIPT